MPNILFDPTIEGLARTLTLHQQRHEVLASNLANVETPGYRARELDFQDVLKEAFEETTGGGGERAEGRASMERASTVVEDKTVAAALAAAGVGIALLPELACVACDGVVRPLRTDLPPRTIALAWCDERLRSVGALQFAKAVTHVVHSFAHVTSNVS